MSYALFVGIALAIHILINIDIGFKKNDFPAIKWYRFFLAAIFIYYVVDMLWGVFDIYKMIPILYADTVIYFLVMGGIILTWTFFIVKYLKSEGLVSKIIRGIGILFFITQVTLTLVNIFYPVIFSLDESGNYLTYPGRDAMLIVQIALYLILFIYTLVTSKLLHSTISKKHLIISIVSLTNALMIAIQFYYPLVPLYSAGCLISVILLTVYTVKDYKDVVKKELATATNLAYTDSLTGVNSRHAYVEMEERVDNKIANHELEEFAVAVFDLNGLKKINDTYGHKVGDQYIIDSIKLIEEYFGKEHLYRFGGDEFVLLLGDENYNKRLILMREFNKEVKKNIKEVNKPVISCGMSDFNKESDNTFRAVFSRADKQMYERKQELKKM